MDIPALEVIGKILVSLIVLFLAWHVLKFVLKSTFRVLRFGCLILLAGLALAWLVGWIG
ncbi:MAG: hypothetical protein PVI78_06320 [Anaerolineales bacterium]|jgi:hypothetical protein